MIDVNAKTSVYTLIGKPVKHSLSPKIYNFGFDFYGLNSVYICSEGESLKELVAGIGALGFKGFNITMPFKNEAMDYIDSCSRLATLCGSVNTVTVDENGKLYGEMTDGHGFVLALQSKGIPIKGNKVEIIGAGGAGRALAVAAIVNGAGEIMISNRRGVNFDKALKLSQELRKFKSFPKLKVKEISELSAYIPDKNTDILVNATSVGMKDDQGSILASADLLSSKMTVFDLVYANDQTRLTEQAKEAGCRNIIGGKRQLLFQAAAAFRLYTGLDYPINEYYYSLKNMIFLVGFMGSGKTTIGKLVSDQLNTEFIDLDKYIEREAGTTISEIFKAEGETEFRHREHLALQKVIKMHHEETVIVAVGGGAVIRDDNYQLMHSCGKIVLLDISFGEVLDRLSSNDRTRPLLYEKNAEDIGYLFRSREEIYRKRQDYSVTVDKRNMVSIVNEICGFIRTRLI